jgi:hypothetical protein
MATWETGAQFSSRREAVGAETLRVLAAGLIVAVLTWGPYWVLRNGAGPVALAPGVGAGALEGSPAVRSTLFVAAVRPPQSSGAAGLSSGRFVLAFGRFERRAAAEARARLVRSKGYIARVVHSGAAYLVVSRPYRDHADAQFWSAVFVKLGLHATTVTRLEALDPQVPALLF